MRQKTVSHLPLLKSSQTNGVQTITVVTTPLFGVRSNSRQKMPTTIWLPFGLRRFEHCKHIIFQNTIQSRRINVPITTRRLQSTEERQTNEHGLAGGLLMCVHMANLNQTHH
jgi:hypothetical protein